MLSDIGLFLFFLHFKTRYFIRIVFEGGHIVDPALVNAPTVFYFLQLIKNHHFDLSCTPFVRESFSAPYVVDSQILSCLLYLGISKRVGSSL
jgi:hypothetical protein